MPRKKSKKLKTKKTAPINFASWNFIIFLTLSFILLVVVVGAVSDISLDLRSRASSSCPTLKLPRAEDCAGGWTFKRGADGCVAFFCEAKQPEMKKQTKTSGSAGAKKL